MENNFETNNNKIEIIKPLTDLDCFANAFRASLDIFTKTDGEILPRIWRVVFPEIKDSHAYLQIGENIYNSGVTWTGNKYPNIDLETVKEKGLDLTTATLVEALLQITKPQSSDKQNLKKAVSSLEHINQNTLEELLNEMIKKSLK